MTSAPLCRACKSRTSISPSLPPTSAGLTTTPWRVTMTTVTTTSQLLRSLEISPGASTIALKAVTNAMTPGCPMIPATSTKFAWKNAQ